MLIRTAKCLFKLGNRKRRPTRLELASSLPQSKELGQQHFTHLSSWQSPSVQEYQLHRPDAIEYPSGPIPRFRFQVYQANFCFLERKMLWSRLCKKSVILTFMPQHKLSTLPTNAYSVWVLPQERDSSWQVDNSGSEPERLSIWRLCWVNLLRFRVLSPAAAFLGGSVPSIPRWA